MWWARGVALPCLLLLIHKEAMEWKRAPPNVAAAAGQAMEEAMVQHAVAAATKTDRGNFLFCIPIQVGPATPYARNVQHWMQGILFLQACMCVCRFIIVKDVVGGLWMVLICGLGFHAWQEDMNITYVCCWGLASAVNGVIDTLGLAFILLSAIGGKLSIFDIVLRVLAPLSELLGVGFAWHLYLDYFNSGQGKGSPISGVLGQLADPMGKLVNSSDPTEYRSLLRAAKDPEIQRDIANPFMQAGSAAVAAGARFASPKPSTRYPQTPGVNFETQGWQQHEQVARDQLGAARGPPAAYESASPFLTHERQAAAASAIQGHPSSPAATRRTYAACC